MIELPPSSVNIYDHASFQGIDNGQEEIHIQIAKDQEACYLLEQETFQAKAALDAVTAKLDSLRATIAERKNLIQPINRIPLEILGGEIFVHWAEAEEAEADARAERGDWSHPKTAIVASSVCRRWRVAAELSHGLWSFLNLDARKETLATRAADQWLSKCGKRPLNIRLRSSSICHGENEADVDSDLMRRLTSGRPWKKFSAQISSHQFCGSILRHFLLSTPTLEELTLDASPISIHHEAPLAHVFPAAPRLRRLVLIDYPSSTWQFEALPRLTTLVLRTSERHFSGFSLAGVARILKSCPNLENLVLNVDIRGHDEPECVTLPRLHSLEIGWRLCLGAHHVHDWLTIPSLKSLRLHRFDTAWGRYNQFIAGLPSTIESLHFDDCGIRQGDWIQLAHKQMRSLKSLHIEASSVTDGFLASLVCSPCADGLPLFPSLTHLKFSNSVRHRGPIDVVSLVERRLKLAEDVGGPVRLESVEVMGCEGFKRCDQEEVWDILDRSRKNFGGFYLDERR